jgi:transposase
MSPPYTFFGVSRVTIYTMRKKYQSKGVQHILDVLQDEPRGGRPMKFDSKVEAQVTMIACSAPHQELHVGRGN